MSRTRFGAFAAALAAIGGVAVAQQRPAGREPAPGPTASQAVQQAGAPAENPRQLAPADEAPDSGVILHREVFAYERAGRRDPFASLLSSDALRPALNELLLTGVLVHPTRPVAVMRGKDGTQYRVTTGMTVGRARVVQIKPRTVIFAITQYGHERRDSLILGDTATARP